MATTEEQPKEIKEYKDFTSVTNIRKFTQEAMSPVIRRYFHKLFQFIAAVISHDGRS